MSEKIIYTLIFSIAIPTKNNAYQAILEFESLAECEIPRGYLLHDRHAGSH